MKVKFLLSMFVVLGLILGCASGSLNQSKPVAEIQWLDKDKVWCPPPAVAPAPVAVKPAPIPPPVIVEKVVKPKFDPIYFDFDKYNIKPSEAAKLDKVAAYAKENPDITWDLVGNCDMKGSVQYNIKLGQKRADAAKAYLVKKGVPERKIITETKGKKFAAKTWEAKDRRVDIYLK